MKFGVEFVIELFAGEFKVIVGAVVSTVKDLWLAMPLLVALSEQLTFQVCCPWLILAMLKLVAVLFRVEEFVEFNILSR